MKKTIATATLMAMADTSGALERDLFLGNRGDATVSRSSNPSISVASATFVLR